MVNCVWDEPRVYVYTYTYLHHETRKRYTKVKRNSGSMQSTKVVFYRQYIKQKETLTTMPVCVFMRSVWSFHYSEHLLQPVIFLTHKCTLRGEVRAEDVIIFLVELHESSESTMGAYDKWAMHITKMYSHPFLSSHDFFMNLRSYTTANSHYVISISCNNLLQDFTFIAKKSYCARCILSMSNYSLYYLKSTYLVVLSYLDLLSNNW